ncbi:MAG: restriction endonuclease subunit S [Cytophagales bacterium]|nr:restriction endonuclease subunit S [Cytophagales bacterium]
MNRTIDLGELIELRRDKVTLDPLDRYKLVTIRMNNKGITQREEKLGSEVSSNSYLAKKGQFLCSKIDARNGAFGILPDYLDGSIVTNDFLTFDVNNDLVLTDFLEFYSNTYAFNQACKNASEGSTNRKRLKVDKFYEIPIPFPEKEVQQKVIAIVNGVSQKNNDIRQLKNQQLEDIDNLLYSTYVDLKRDCPTEKMRIVAPITRRPVEVETEDDYPEMGIRSFGKGTFHKPSLKGIDVGTKKLFYIKSGDLMFSNVFAWEGAIAVATEEDNDRVGSHRFISCVPDHQKVLPHYLCFHFLSPKGMENIRKASPGGAGRNKTLGLTKLENIEVPIPPLDKQREFEELLEKTRQMKAHIAASQQELDELLPALLDKAFKGELV